jgi:hypothetical protein
MSVESSKIPKMHHAKGGCFKEWEREDRYVECKLVTGKTQVALKIKRAVQWMELVEAVNAARLA